jgi:hypothetical protein
MHANTDEIFQAALKLSDSDRLVLVSRLLETVPDTANTISVDDPGFLEEMERRFSNREGSVPWSELQGEP